MFDLTRLAFVARHRREEMELTMRKLEAITGVSKSQISRMEHGQAISAGNTFMMMEALDIRPEDMLSARASERLGKIRSLKREIASHETSSETKQLEVAE